MQILRPERLGDEVCEAFILQVLGHVFIDRGGEGDDRDLVVAFPDIDGNANATVDDDEVRLVFPGVMNFQLALGFDSNPDNGRVVDSRTSTDEFVGNVASDGAAGLSAVGLRMAQVGVITGTRAVEPGARTLQVLDGPTVTNPSLILRRAVGKALLRNVAVFY